MDKGFEALKAVQALILDDGAKAHLDALDLNAVPSQSAPSVSAFLGKLNEWGQRLTAIANQQYAQQDYADYMVTSNVLSRVTSWWLWANHTLIQTMDASPQVAAAIAAIQKATADLGTAEANFDNGTKPLTDVAPILDGLLGFFKTVVS